MNRLQQLRAHHAQCVKDYVRFWRNREERESVQMNVEEAAYYFLKHAGMFYRFTGDPSLFTKFSVQENSERRELALDACRYIVRLTDVDQVRRALEPPDEGGLDELEFVLMNRDDLGVVMEMIRVVCRDFLESDAEVQDAFLDAVCAEAEFDDLLREHRERVAFAAQPLLDLAKYMQIPVNPWQWWFTETPEWQEQAFSTPIAALIGGVQPALAAAQAEAAPERHTYVARLSDGALDIQEWLSRFRDLLFGGVPQAAMAMADQATADFTFEVNDLVSAHEPFSVNATLHANKNALEVEVSDKDDGVSRLLWLEGATMAVSSPGGEERFPFNQALGTCQIKFMQVQPTSSTHFEIRDRENNRVCTLRLLPSA